MGHNLDVALRYLRAVESGATGEALTQFFTEDVMVEELPNRVVPNGARRGLPGLLDGAKRGQQIMASQKYDVSSAIESDDLVILEVLWTGTLKVPIGSLPAGGEMRAWSAMFMKFRDGKIASQRNYDCFEPW
jgi:ketosteroid isomerase-like protein